MSDRNARSGSRGKELADRLDEVLSEFERAWDEGRAPSIEAYLQANEAQRSQLLVELAHTDLECRLKAGEAARVETYFQRFADLAADRPTALGLIAFEYTLRRRLEPALGVDEYFERFPQYRADLAERLPGPHSRPAASRPESSSQCLGQFELLETVGQGSFGTVYRARDLELDRIVALKVPRSDRAATLADEERFVREARNAAQLNHPGIVPVYEVRRDAAVPHIVSAFVQGVTLADVMAKQRLDFRQTADLIAQVAEALDHAHQQGVVHRDLKPSNIMLGRIEGAKSRSQDSGVRNQESGVKNQESGIRSQESGVKSKESATASRESTIVDGQTHRLRAFVTDFGLARREEGDVRLTVEGQILGTPAYMSPEQARGEIHRIDGRSDLYSAGVILYELLTGELPFRGVTRMMLQQIVEEEPRPPRRLNDKIPRDLETIALKCLAKEPARRYPTAAALAEDLRRYLDGRPILARPIGRLQRTWRWAKRNPRVAALTALSLLLLTALAVGGTIAALVINARKNAESQARADAERNFDLALDALKNVVYKIQDELIDQPSLYQLREQLLGDALDNLKRLAVLTETRETDQTKFKGHQRLGETYLLLGKIPEAREQYEQCQTVARRLEANDPESIDNRRWLCVATAKLAEVSLRLNDLGAAETYCAEAVARADALYTAAPDDLLVAPVVALCYQQLAAVKVQRGDLHAGASFYEREVELGQRTLDANPGNDNSRLDLAEANDHVGDTQLKLGMQADARKAYEASSKLRQELLTTNPGSARAKQALSNSHEKLGDLALRDGNGREAEKSYLRTLEIREELAGEAPRNSMLQWELSRAYGKLGDAAEKLGNRHEARAKFEKALERMDILARAYPKDVRFQHDRAVAHLRLGIANRRLGEPTRARDHFRKALADFEQVAAADCDNVPAQLDLAACNGNCGNFEKGLRDFPSAASYYERGVAILQRLQSTGKLADQSQPQGWLRDQQGNLLFCNDVIRTIDDPEYARTKPPKLAAQLLTRRAQVLADQGQHASVVETAERLRSVADQDPIALYNIGCCYARCVPLVAPKKAADQLTSEERALRDHYADRAIAALKESVERGFKDVKLLESDADLAAIRDTDGYREAVNRLKPRP